MPSNTPPRKPKPALKNNAVKPPWRAYAVTRNKPSNKAKLMLLPLMLLLTACAQHSTPPSVEPPAVPPLPLEARQGQTNPLCSPTCLQSWSKKVEQWQQKLTAEE